DTEDEGDRRYIVMEFIDGRSLKEYLDEVAILDERDAVDVTIQVADALEYGHQAGIIHCDVKPGNILVDRRGRAKLVDFGIARLATQTWAMATTVLGTAAYMAPENVEGTRPDQRSDVYSLALVLYEMLAGRLPFEGESVAAVTAQRLVRDPIPLRRFNSEVSPQLERIIMRALARDPAERPQSAAEFGDLLRRHASGAPVGVAAPTPMMGPQTQATRRARPAPMGAPPRRRGGGFWAALATIIIALALFALAFGVTVALIGDDFLQGGGGDDDDAETIDTPTEEATEEAPTAEPTEPPATETATPEPTETATPEPTPEATDTPDPTATACPEGFVCVTATP
ncbi:MAG: protein kinase, partial [Dehalococcoidia bacterium]|nr:protein kinase [Dehalococcoidia bacterium]